MRLDVSGGQAHLKIVESDIYNIAERVRQLDPRLVIVVHEDAEFPFVVMEEGPDGVSRFVKRYKELDQRVIDDLRYMQSVPFDERLKMADREINKNNAALEDIDEDMLDWIATEMRRELIKSGMSDRSKGAFFRGG